MKEKLSFLIPLFLLLILWFFWRPSILFLPGLILFTVQMFVNNFSFVETLITGVGFSLSYWIIGYRLLQVIPLSFQFFLIFSLCIWVLLYLIRIRNVREVFWSRFAKTDIVAGLFVLSIFLLYLMPLTKQIAPSGADMSMHTYIAQVILHSEKFPQSYKPLLPIDHFGKYPIGFPTIVAAMSWVDGKPMYQNALVLSVFTYFLFDVFFYMFLRSRFSVAVSIITTVVISWMTHDPHDIIGWGGNPTVLSLAFVFLGMGIFFKCKTNVSIVLSTLMFIAAFLTHGVFVIGSLYLYATILPVVVFWSHERKITLSHFIIISLTLSVLAFILYYPFRLSAVQQNYLIDWNRKDFQWQGDISNAITTIPRYIADRIGNEVFALGIISWLFLIATRHFDVVISTFVMFLAICGLILNSHYLFLPFSVFLYPDRVVLLVLFPMALTLGAFHEKVIVDLDNLVRKIFSSARSFIPYVPLIAAYGFFYFPLMMKNYTRFSNFADAVSVTQEDLRAFEWLRHRTTTEDVIWNNYSDAGLWIPAIIYRPITVNHSNPFDIKDEGIVRNKKKPTYIYIGKKMVYPEGDSSLQNFVMENPDKAIKEYDRDGVQIYRIVQ